jgi:uncharacterized protein GlcG (DUF336 family)
VQSTLDVRDNLIRCPANAILKRPSRADQQIREEHMTARNKTILASILIITLATAAASAQQAPTAPPTTSYGPPIGLEAAKKVMAAAEADAIKNNWGMAIAILDSTGHMVMLHKLDNTQYGSIAVAEDKAPQRALLSAAEQGIRGPGSAGRPRSAHACASRRVAPLEGGIPLVLDGKIVGAIGVSGATSVQDGQVAKAGADAMK